MTSCSDWCGQPECKVSCQMIHQRNLTVGTIRADSEFGGYFDHVIDEDIEGPLYMFNFTGSPDTLWGPLRDYNVPVEAVLGVIENFHSDKDAGYCESHCGIKECDVRCVE